MLFNSERFQTEYRRFREELEQVTDVKLKIEINAFLERLVSAVQTIDTHHEELLINRNPSTDVIELRNTIQRLRQEIDTKLKTWQIARR